MIGSTLHQKKVLLCPLNWGLGHAARSIPIAREFQKQGYSVDFASDGAPLELLRKEFPTARFFELPGFRITYPTNNIVINVGRKMIQFITALRAEHKVVREIVDQHKYDIVVSDNRFGCYSPDTYNIFITHQVNIMTSSGLLDPAVNIFNHHYIRKYHQCWIPDYPNSPGLTGQLGHDHILPHARYIGPVSRFSRARRPERFRLAAVLSGPEPQRSLLEKQLRQQLSRFPFPTVLIGGVVSDDVPVQREENMTHYPFLTSQELNEVMLESHIIVCRGGYTTIMDLVALGKKAICIPTPGQTEQEYLTRLYEEKRYFLRQEQHDLDLASALERIDAYTGIPMDIEQELMEKAVSDLKEYLPG